VSAGGKGLRKTGQVSDRKRTEREPLMTCRNVKDDVETTGVNDCGISSGETCLRPERHPALRWPESVRRRLCGTWEPGAAMRTEKSKWRTHEDERTEALHRGGITRSSDEVPEKRMERRGDVVEPNSTRQPAMGGTDE